MSEDDFSYKVGQQVKITKDFINEMEEDMGREILIKPLIDFYDKYKDKTMTLVRVDDETGDGLFIEGEPDLELDCWYIETLDDPHTPMNDDVLDEFKIFYVDETGDMGTVH